MNENEVQNNEQAQEPTKTFNERVNEALNTQSVSEQIKTTLLVAFELVQGFNELNEHYKKDLEQFNDNFAKSEELYLQFAAEKAKFEANYTEILENLTQTRKEFKDEVARIETIKNTIEAINTNIQTMSANIAAQKKEVEKLVDSLDLAGIDERIKTLNAKIETTNELLPTLNAKAQELGEFVNQQKIDLEQYIAQFRASLDEIDFVQNTAPNSGLNGQSWLDTSKGVINIFSQNERIRFVQKDEPTNFARLGDGWCKNGINNASDELLLFTKQNSLNEWQKLKLNALEFDTIDFKQVDEPELSAANESKAWLKMNALNVFYLENRSFVQIDKKLVRFTSESEPNATIETIQVNDIWKKSDDEIYICTSYTPAILKVDENSGLASIEAPAKAEWTLLELAYKTAKFKRAVLPSDDEIANDDETDNANKVQMRDLVFVVDESELYYCVRNSYNGSDFAGFSWVKKADFATNARFKGESEPQELFENDLWFATKSDDLQTKDGTEGVLKVLKPKERRAEWVSLAYAKKYAAYKSELMPDTKYLKDYDAWYRPLSDEPYIFADGYFHLVQKCNAFCAKKAYLNTELQDEPVFLRNDWIMRKFAGWQSVVINGYFPAQLYKLPTDLNSVGHNENSLFIFPANLEFFSGKAGAVFSAVFNQYVDFFDANDKLYFEKINALSDDEVFIVFNITQSYEWVNAVYPKDISAFLWQNDLEKRVSVIEKLFLPDGILREKVKENDIIAPNFPQQVVNLAYLNGALGELYEKITRKNDEYHSNVTDAVKIDDENVKVEIDFSYGKNFSVDLTNAAKTNYELVVANDELSLNELQGQSGVIAVVAANKLKTTLGDKFNVRVALQGLGELEIFSYVIYKDKVRLTRS